MKLETEVLWMEVVPFLAKSNQGGWSIYSAQSITQLGKARTGWPPIRETAASMISFSTSTLPSGMPSSTSVSTPARRSSSSESDRSP